MVDMAEERTARHLRVVRAARRVDLVAGDDAAAEADREAYWTRLEALRAERQRLRAG